MDQVNLVSAVVTLLTSGAVLALVGGIRKFGQKWFSGATTKAKDLYSEMQSQRDELADEVELLHTERDQALRMVARRDRALIVGGLDIPDDAGDTPYMPPPRAPKVRKPRKQSDDDQT